MTNGPPYCQPGSAAVDGVFGPIARSLISRWTGSEPRLPSQSRLERGAWIRNPIQLSLVEAADPRNPIQLSRMEAAQALHSIELSRAERMSAVYSMELCRDTGRPRSSRRRDCLRRSALLWRVERAGVDGESASGGSFVGGECPTVQ